MDYKGKPLNDDQNTPIGVDIDSAIEHELIGGTPIYPSNPQEWKIPQGILRNRDKLREVIAEREKWSGFTSPVVGSALGFGNPAVFDYPPVKPETGEAIRCPRVVGKLSDNGTLEVFDPQTSDRFTKEIYKKVIGWIYEMAHKKNLIEGFIASLDPELRPASPEIHNGSIERKI